MAKEPNPPCRSIVDLSHVAPGWSCCACKGYNGAHRTACKFCGHGCCLAPEERTKVVAKHNALFPYFKVE